MDDPPQNARPIDEVVLYRWSHRLLALEAIYLDVAGQLQVPSTAHSRLRPLVEATASEATEVVLVSAGLLERPPVPALGTCLTILGLSLIEQALLDPQLRTPYGTLAGARALAAPQLRRRST